MTQIRSQERLDSIIKVAEKWYNPKTATIERRMKDVTKLIEYADKIAKLYFIPNALDGRGDYRNRYEYYKQVEILNTRDGEYKERITEHYCPIITDSYTGKESKGHGVATIVKSGNYWHYTLTGVRIHKDKPMLFS